MSQSEQRIRALLARKPEIEKAYGYGLVNRRALARYLIRLGVAEPSELEAVVATLRRHDFGRPGKEPEDLFREVRVSLKDRILILDFEKERALLKRLERLISEIDYDRGDTFKVVVGTSSLKLFIDRKKEKALSSLFQPFKLRARLDRITELSLMFPEEAIRTRSVLAVLARELALNDIVITELLTASPELLIYLKDEFVPKAYEVVRELQQPSGGRARGGG